MVKKIGRIFTIVGRGGAGRGGGCLAFLGGNAGLGDSGRGGGPADELFPCPPGLRI